jgi:hypothetical protein
MTFPFKVSNAFAGSVLPVDADLALPQLALDPRHRDKLHGFPALTALAEFPCHSVLTIAE